MSDTDIRAELESGRLVCAPLAESAIQPASIDVRLGNQFRVFVNHRHAYIDVRDPQADLTELEVIQGDEPFVLHPNEFVLATTIELVKIPDYLVARVEGKSSLGRLGLLVHATAGFVDPGFDGRLTLELSNVASLPIRLYANMKIGQLSFQHLTSPAEHPYGHPALGSRYQGQDLPTASRMYRDFSRS